VEYKAWWVADLVDLPAAFEGTRGGILSRQSLESLEQIYGYMTFNNNRYGILTNWQRAWFLRRSETALECFVVELDGSQGNPPISMLKAWVGMVLLAENDWFYASPTPPPARMLVRNAEEYQSLPVNGEYRCLPLDHRLCIFDLSSARRGANGCTANAQFLQSSSGLPLVCKVVDVLRSPDTKELVRGEMLAYAALQTLQGKVIPTLHGYYEVWGILHLLALQPVGDAIPEDDDKTIDVTLRKKMKANLRRIHDAGSPVCPR
jgi:hypothetical protein